MLRNAAGTSANKATVRTRDETGSLISLLWPPETNLRRDFRKLCRAYCNACTEAMCLAAHRSRVRFRFDDTSHLARVQATCSNEPWPTGELL
jgi:hypothetical protein